MAWGYQSAKSAGQSVQEFLLLHQPHLDPGHPEPFPADGSGLWSEDTAPLVQVSSAEQEQGPAAPGCSELHAVTDTPAEQSTSSYNHSCSVDTALARQASAA